MNTAIQNWQRGCRTAHEWRECATEVVALEARQGARYAVLWRQLKMRECAAVRETLESLVSDDERLNQTNENITSSQGQQLRCLGILEPDTLAEFELHALEKIGRTYPSGYTLSSQLAVEPEKNKQNSNEANAMDRLSDEHLIFTQRSPTSSLRLLRYDDVVEVTTEAWKRALLEEIAFCLQQAQVSGVCRTAVNSPVES